MRSDLRDKVVCITGAAGGIGRAIAKAFAWEGADLALLDRDKTGVEELAAALRITGVTVQTTVVDLRTAHGVREGMQAALAPFGGVLDILVPNVGALIAGPFETLESGQLQEAFAINFFTHVYACRVAVPLMKERGGPGSLRAGQGGHPQLRQNARAGVGCRWHPRECSRAGHDQDTPGRGPDGAARTGVGD